MLEAAGTLLNGYPISFNKIPARDLGTYPYNFKQGVVCKEYKRETKLRTITWPEGGRGRGTLTANNLLEGYPVTCINIPLSPYWFSKTTVLLFHLSIRKKKSDPLPNLNPG